MGLDRERHLRDSRTVRLGYQLLFVAQLHGRTRRREGWDGVALLDCQQMAVAGDLPRCIRLLAHAWLEQHQPVRHAYLRDASRLRPDLAG